MIQHFLKSRRILALLLVAVLALVQVNVAFAGCLTADPGTTTAISAMDDCPGCSNAAKEADRYDALTNICSNHCLRSYISPAHAPEMLAIATVTLVNAKAAPPPRISPHIRAAYTGKSRLIYRLQRLLI